MVRKSAAASLTASDVYERVSGSVFTVYVLDADTRKLIGHGSAVAVSKRHLITNWHVASAGDLLVIENAKHRGAATVYAADADNDLCWLESVNLELHPIEAIRAFATLKVGETVYSLGSPGPIALETSLGPGVVSGKRADFYVQTTAPISGGSSGGGLFDAQGNLVGITVGSIPDAQQLNFAIRADAFWDTHKK
jgi:S1-C subfamily serine protease